MKRSIITFLLFVLAPSLAWSATCKISEYANLPRDPSSAVIPVAPEPALATQSVTYTSSTQSSAFNILTRYVRIVCDAKAHFVFAENGTATATDPYLPADTVEYFGIRRSDSDGDGDQDLEVAFYDGTT